MASASAVRLRSAGTQAAGIRAERLRAGPVTLLYESGSVRYLKHEDDEIVRRIYFALRDRNWNTIEGSISEEEINASDEDFLVSFVSTHEAGPIRFVWKGEIRGERDGRIVFAMDGLVTNSFYRNRIGLCVLHPMEIAGKPCTVTHTDGTTESSVFPAFISPHQPFFRIRKLDYSPSARTSATVEFEGEVFEMEDQRNWTDASFKTYSTPLDLPFPVELGAGTKIRQSVIVRPSLDAGDRARPRSRQVAKSGVSIRIEKQQRFRVPELGFVWRSFPSKHPGLVLERIRALRPDHLRCDVHPGAEAVDSICATLASAQELGVPLEIGLFLGKDEERDLNRTEAALKNTRPSLKRVLVFKEERKSTPSACIRLARQVLKSFSASIEICGGTDAFFAEVNRERPDMSVADGISFSINPQVHVFDNASLVESLAAQRATIETAKSFSASKPIHVSPVTFRMRWNPNATAPEEDSTEGGIPPQVDPRQLSLFGAAWTAGSIHSLGLAGAASVTYFETVGCRGLMEQEQPVLPFDLFPSIPQAVFPLYFVFLELSRLKGGRAVQTQSEEPLLVDALAVEKDGRILIAVSNHADQEIAVLLPDVAGDSEIRHLDIKSYETCSTNPEKYFDTMTRGTNANGRLELTLSPNGMAFVTF